MEFNWLWMELIIMKPLSQDDACDPFTYKAAFTTTFCEGAQEGLRV